ncbi:MAG TPA: hypothetical protein VKR53_21130, partial [Puia sp.]|nr:hypothetical protein [Puia sp.]
MKVLSATVFVIVLVFFHHDAAGQTHANNETFLEQLLKQYPAFFGTILQNKDSFKVQIIYTRINRDPANNPSFTNFYFNV